MCFKLKLSSIYLLASTCHCLLFANLYFRGTNGHTRDSPTIAAVFVCCVHKSLLALVLSFKQQGSEKGDCCWSHERAGSVNCTSCLAGTFSRNPSECSCRESTSTCTEAMLLFFFLRPIQIYKGIRDHSFKFVCVQEPRIQKLVPPAFQDRIHLWQVLPLILWWATACTQFHSALCCNTIQYSGHSKPFFCDISAFSTLKFSHSAFESRSWKYSKTAYQTACPNVFLVSFGKLKAGLWNAFRYDSAGTP